MKSLLILTALFSCVNFFLIISAYSLLEKRREQALTQQMQKYSKSLQNSKMFQDSFLTSDKNPKLKILIWTRSYHSWIAILDFVQGLTFTVLLVVALVLVVS